MMIYTTTYEGHVETRKSAGHLEPIYKFAVWGLGTWKGKAQWGVLCYCSRMELAQAQLRQRQAHYGAGNINIAAVTAELKAVKPKPDVDFPGAEFELGGIKFDSNTPRYSRVGEYQGWKVLLSCTGRVFRASATRDLDTWSGRLYVANGGLKTRIEAIKAAIDAEVTKAA